MKKVLTKKKYVVPSMQILELESTQILAEVKSILHLL